VIPKRPGTIVIEKVEWELLGLFRCEMPFVATAKDQDISSKLKYKEKTFTYKVLPASAELSATMKLDNDF